MYCDKWSKHELNVQQQILILSPFLYFSFFPLIQYILLRSLMLIQNLGLLSCIQYTITIHIRENVNCDFLKFDFNCVFEPVKRKGLVLLPMIFHFLKTQNYISKHLRLHKTFFGATGFYSLLKSTNSRFKKGKMGFLRLRFTQGPFIYYVSTCRGEGGGQKMPIFAYSQY